MASLTCPVCKRYANILLTYHCSNSRCRLFDAKIKDPTAFKISEEVLFTCDDGKANWSGEEELPTFQRLSFRVDYFLPSKEKQATNVIWRIVNTFHQQFVFFDLYPNYYAPASALIRKPEDLSIPEIEIDP